MEPRSPAKALDLSDSTVGRVWRAHGLKPHLIRTFKVSHDPRFAESRAQRDSRTNFLQIESGNLEEVIGLYLNAPGHALVLCCDEPSGAR